MPLYALDGERPRVAASAFVAPTATLIGDVTVGEDASVWFGAVVVGAGSCVQDNAMLHSTEELPTILGENVTIGHLAQLEGCVVEDGALIGTGAIVLPRARVGARSMVAAGAVVREGHEIPAGMLATGTPADARKPLEGSALRWVESAAADYQRLKERYRREGADTLTQLDEPEED